MSSGGVASPAKACHSRRMPDFSLFGDEHVRRYEETDGEVGHEWKEGVPTLVLTTKGRKTGEPRTVMLTPIARELT